MNKPWYKSKTKIGSVLLGGGLILKAAGSYLLGDVDPGTAVQEFLAGLGILLFGLGLRDAIAPK